MSLIKPKKFGNYLILEPITNDHPIQSFRAVDITSSFFSRFLKIKMIHPDDMGDPTAIQKLIFEAKLNQELGHPNIAGFIDAGKMNGRPYIVEEYIWGKSLLQIFRKLRDSKKLLGHHHVAYIASEIAKAVGYAHSVKLSWAGDRPVVHQNINPRNIIISYDGTVHVLDFGVAPLKIDPSSLAKYDFRRLGYFSPEQANRLGVDFRTDIFTTGTLMYEMLTGYPAFLEKNAKKVLKRIRVNDYIPIRKMVPTIPRALETIVEMAMTDEKANRIPSMPLMESMLDEYLDKRFPDFTSNNLGTMVKGLFITDIKREIKTFYEMFKTTRGKEGKVLKSIPVILFNLIKMDDLDKKKVKHQLSSSPKHSREAKEVKPRTVTAPTKPAILKPDLPASFDDEHTILDDDYFNKGNRGSKSEYLHHLQFSDEETRMLMENTDQVMFEDEKTILLTDDNYDFDDDKHLIIESHSSLQDQFSSTNRRSKSGRSPTGFFKAVDTLHPKKGVSSQNDELLPISVNSGGDGSVNRNLFILIGVIIALITALIIYLLLS